MGVETFLMVMHGGWVTVPPDLAWSSIMICTIYYYRVFTSQWLKCVCVWFKSSSLEKGNKSWTKYIWRYNNSTFICDGKMAATDNSLLNFLGLSKLVLNADKNSKLFKLFSKFWKFKLYLAIFVIYLLRKCTYCGNIQLQSFMWCFCGMWVCKVLTNW